MIEVRDARIGDADAIATAHIDAWRVAYRGLVPDEYLDSEAFASSRRDRWRAWTWQSIRGSRLFVVTMNGRVVGWSHSGPERVEGAPSETGSSRRGEVYGFYVHPSAWGSGSAGALMSRCEESLRDEGFASAILWVLRDNPRARAFYEKVGWQFSGRESTFVPSGSPGIAMPEVEYEVSL